MVDWDWDARPTYESDRIRIDATASPVVLSDLLLPRQLEDHEINLMLSIAESRLENGLPYVGLIRQRRGTGVISARHRKVFADWLDDRRDRLSQARFAIAVVMPEAIFRAVLRVVYRFRTPPLRTVTISDLEAAREAVLAELDRMSEPVTPEVERWLDALS